MEARIYFRRTSVEKRLKELNALSEDSSNYVDNSHTIGIEKLTKNVFVKTSEYHNLEIPSFFKGLKVVKITIFDSLNKEENVHIKQGQGTESKSKWSIYYTDVKFEIPSNVSYSLADAYKSVIKIRIFSTNLQSAKACYDKIRKGEMDDNWKGSPYKPSHCGLPENFSQM